MGELIPTSPEPTLSLPGARTSPGRLLGFFFSSRRRHTRLQGDWSSDVCSSDLRTIMGMVWTAWGKAARVVLQFLILAAMARLLSPAEFGVVSAALVVTGFSTIFSRSEERRVGKECRSRWSPYH